jgi:Glycine/D-amino acid oxidases (deaminating)
LIGASIALELAQAGLHVGVFDAREPGREASWASAGIISPAPEGPGMIPLVALSKASAAMYPKFIEAVEEASGQKVEYRPNGAVGSVLGRRCAGGDQHAAGGLSRRGIASGSVDGRTSEGNGARPDGRSARRRAAARREFGGQPSVDASDPGGGKAQRRGHFYGKWGDKNLEGRRALQGAAADERTRGSEVDNYCGGMLFGEDRRSGAVCSGVADERTDGGAAVRGSEDPARALVGEYLSGSAK